VRDVSKLTPGERAHFYRERAAEVRLVAAKATGDELESLIKVARDWERLAQEAEKEAREKR
jgi:hypothetical protein